MEESNMSRRPRREFTEEFKLQIIRLKKENQQLKMENDILKQAALILGQKSK